MSKKYPGNDYKKRWADYVSVCVWLLLWVNWSKVCIKIYFWNIWKIKNWLNFAS